MREIYTKIEQLKNMINDIQDEKYNNIFNSISDILLDLSSKVEDLNIRQEYLEENMEYIDNDLTDIQDELFEEVSFDEKCNKPLFVEQQALNNNNNIPCPFCGGIANK